METNICIDDIKIKKDKDTTVFYRDNGFHIIGNGMGNGMGYVKSIIYHGMGNREQPLPYTIGEIDDEEIFKEKNQYLNAIIEFKKIENPTTAILSPQELVKFDALNTENITIFVNIYPGNKLFLSILLFIKHDLDTKTLIMILKSVIDSKAAALWDMGVINHFSFDPFDLEDNESIIIASTGSNDTISPQKTNILVKEVQSGVRQAVNNALGYNGYPKDVLEYMRDVGVEVDDLVDAGMELVVGVEETPEICEKLRKQIYHSLEDLNVVSFIIAGIRLEEDYEKHRVLGVDVDVDPAYLYSDEVFGMSVANQIAGTKAIFNFKRYDEEKPGIISKLGPVLDDIFAGLIAGCMSKIFEV
ncbi:MAG: phosphatidylglycerophosphatase A [Methanobacterium sp.]|nr:phosphatidylglycerophosphatase A [Methanobacterium sp.]